MSIDNEIISQFIQESKDLIDPLLGMLEDLEGTEPNPSQIADYGNKVDRVMGGAKNLALMVPETHPIHTIGNYTALCKAVAYKASKIDNNDQLYRVSLAFLIDATEILVSIVEELEKDPNDFKLSFSETFIERLRWISNQFSNDISGTVTTKSASKKMAQDDIDALMAKLGVS